jgi:hypothetical protein
VRPTARSRSARTCDVRAEGVEILARNLPDTFRRVHEQPRRTRRHGLRCAQRSARRAGGALSRRERSQRRARLVGDAAVELVPASTPTTLSYVSDRSSGTSRIMTSCMERHGQRLGLRSERGVGATVTLPAAVPPTRSGWRPTRGRRARRAASVTAGIDAGRRTLPHTRALGPGEGLTIVASWPKGQRCAARRPTPRRLPCSAMRGRRCSRRRGWLLLILYYWRLERSRARPAPGCIVVPHYEAPKVNRRPRCAYLTRMAYDDSVLRGPRLLALAVKGGLRIRAGEQGTLRPQERVHAASHGTQGRRGESRFAGEGVPNGSACATSVFASGPSVEL